MQIILIVIPCCCAGDTNGSFSPIGNYADLVISVRENLRAGCVNSLFASESIIPDLLTTKELLLFEKRLSQQGVQTSVTNLMTLELDARMQCHNTPSLFVLFSCDEMTRRALQILSANENVSISGPRWLLFLDASYTIAEFFVDIHVPFDCRFLVAQQQPPGGVSLTEVYRVARSRPLETYAYGSWSAAGGLDATRTQLYERRDNLRGLDMRATAIHEPPITMLIEEDNQTVIIDGYFGRVWSLLGERINFTTTFKECDDHAWGSFEEGSGWNGMIRMIVDREVDVAVAEFWITEDRSEVIDYTLPLLFTRYRVIAQNPLWLDIVQWTDVFAPFTAPLWLTVVCTIFVLALLLTALHYVGRRCGNEEADGPPNYTFYNSIHYVIGVFCHQGHHTTPRAGSCRTVYLVAYITAVMLMGSYSASLITFISYRDVKLPFTDLQGLLDDGTYKFAVLNKSAEYDIFQTSEDAVMREVFSKHIAPNTDRLPTSAQEGLMLVCNDSRYTFFVSFDIALGAYALGHVHCDLTVLEDVSAYAGLSIGMSKQNPYRGVVNYNLQKMRDCGILSRLRAQFWPPSMPERQRVHMQVYMVAVAPMFAILSGGAMLAVFCLLAERWRLLVNHQRRDLVGEQRRQSETHTETYRNIREY